MAAAFEYYEKAAFDTKTSPQPWSHGSCLLVKYFPTALVPGFIYSWGRSYAKAGTVVPAMVFVKPVIHRKLSILSKSKSKSLM